jgi:hypothetical protein
MRIALLQYMKIQVSLTSPFACTIVKYGTCVVMITCMYVVCSVVLTPLCSDVVILRRSAEWHASQRNNEAAKQRRDEATERRIKKTGNIELKRTDETYAHLPAFFPRLPKLDPPQIKTPSILKNHRRSLTSLIRKGLYFSYQYTSPIKLPM